MLDKGEKVRLSEYGLNFLYPSLASKSLRNRMANEVFIVVGYSRDYKGTRVVKEGGSPNSQTTYANSFLEKVKPS